MFYICGVLWGAAISAAERTAAGFGAGADAVAMSVVCAAESMQQHPQQLLRSVESLSLLLSLRCSCSLTVVTQHGAVQVAGGSGSWVPVLLLCLEVNSAQRATLALPSHELDTRHALSSVAPKLLPPHHVGRETARTATELRVELRRATPARFWRAKAIFGVGSDEGEI